MASCTAYQPAPTGLGLRSMPAVGTRPAHCAIAQPCVARRSKKTPRNAEEELPSDHADVHNLQLDSRTRWTKHLALMGLSGAALGPLLDGYHSAFGVLKYSNPKEIFIGSIFLCETDFWVPPMFALAAIILGATYPIFDSIFDVDARQRAPRGPSILTCISYFCLQYYMSGVLSAGGVDGVELHGFLASTAFACWYTWDRTLTGAVMTLTTGIAGPCVEIGLLQAYPALMGSELYHYNSPDVLGIPLWISWVYGCGAPAVGNLARGVWRFVEGTNKMQGPYVRKDGDSR